MEGLSSSFLSSRCAVILSRTSRLTGSALRILCPRATAEVDIQKIKLQETKIRRHVVSREGAQRPGKAVWRGSLAEDRPDLALQWIQERNGDVTPESVPAGSRFRAAWRCGKRCKHCRNPHEWHATVGDRCLGDTGCPLCSGLRVCRCQSLAVLCPDLLKEWDYERNRGIDPGTLGCSSHKNVSWVCKAHGPWNVLVKHRAARGTGCPICAQDERVQSRSKRGLVKDEFPDVWRQIHPSRNKGVDVSSLTCGSRKKLVWLCQENMESRPKGCKCEHAWEASVHSRCAKVKRHQTGCPFCSGRAVCECLSIAKLQPELMQYWCSSLNAELDPKAIGLESNKRAWWEHVCVDGKMHRRHLAVNNVQRNLKRTGRFPCKSCAGNEKSVLYAKHRAGCLVDD